LKALVLYEKQNEATELRDVPYPEFGPGDVIIKIKAAAICGADIEFYRAKLTSILKPPVILGHEFCGVIEEIGRDVTEWEPGDRVVSDNTGYVCGKCFACLTGQYVLCPERKGIGYSMNGGFTEYVRIPEQILKRMPDCLHHLPDSLSFTEGAILEPSVNAYKAVIQEAQLNAGETIAIFGPGPIGLFCLIIARIAGASKIVLIGLSDDQKRLAMGKQLGADIIVNADKQKVGEIVRSSISKEGVDVVIDAAGAEEVIVNAAEILRPSGRIIRIAWGNIVQRINLDPLMAKAGTLIGHFGYNYLSWRNVLRLAERGVIPYKEMISKIYHLEHWKQAFTSVENKKVIKAVFTLG
jgi:threonine dehydrogenase-like Zn-dependent dehydrogenase